MERYLIAAGLVLNSLVIVVNRFIKEIPDWIAIPLLVIGIALMITGAFLMKQ